MVENVPWTLGLLYTKSNPKITIPLRNWGRLLLEFVGVLRPEKVSPATLSVQQTFRGQESDLLIER